MRICQISQTIQGEGYNLGKPCILIRFVGCNLNCPWCDTPYALKKINGTKYIVNKLKELILKIIDDTDITHFMITGGEPLLYHNDIIEVYNKIINTGKCISFEMETNGLLLKNNHDNIHYNISPKLDIKCYNDEEIKNIDDIIKLYNKIEIPKNYSLKIVYKKEWESDIIKFLTHNELYDLNKLYIMPYWNEKEDFHKANLDTIRFCINYNFRYTPRQHIYLFGTGNQEYLHIK